MKRDLPPILVVDDDDDVRSAMVLQLAAGGYRVEAYADPIKALAALRKVQFLAILSDHSMPEMSGLDLLTNARELQGSATRMLITGVLTLDSLLGAIECGLVHRFLAKPWGRVELLAAVAGAASLFRLNLEAEQNRLENLRLARELTTVQAKLDLLLELANGGAVQIRAVKPSEIRPGMRFAEPISGPSGQPLLLAGEELTATAMARLQNSGWMEDSPPLLAVYG